MIVELGHFALVLSLAVALVQSVVPLVGADRRWSGWMAVAEPAAVTQLLLIGFSFAALTWAFVTSDFSVRLVVLNSHTLKPMLYKISGVWGEPRGLAAPVGADPRAVRSLRRGLRAEPAAHAQGARAGGAGG